MATAPNTAPRQKKKEKKKKGKKNYSNGSQTASVEGDSAPNPRLGALLQEMRGEVTRWGDRGGMWDGIPQNEPGE